MYIAQADFNTHLYAHIIAAIDPGSEDLLDDAIAAAEGEAKGYLTRFDLTILFGQTGEDRDKLLMMYLKDMAVWHFIPLGNPDTDMALRRTRYEDAISWLKDIQRGRVTPENWPLPSTEEAGDDIIQVSSRTRRETNW